ncbi:MAG: dihydroneopterin aldolase [Elainella sp.]
MHLPPASLPLADCMQINGIRAYGYIGFLPEEQVLGQWFEVDLTIWTDLAEAGKTDRLEDTYDYSQVVPQIQQLIETVKYQLIEKLAAEIAQLVLAAPKARQVRVRLTKPNPPIPDFSGQIVLDITRSRV